MLGFYLLQIPFILAAIAFLMMLHHHHFAIFRGFFEKCSFFYLPHTDVLTYDHSCRSSQVDDGQQYEQYLFQRDKDMK